MWAMKTKEHSMESFEYLLELSMSMSGCETDHHALREAHASLAALNDDCGAPASMWSFWPATRGTQTLVRTAA
jgi:hypothetical protein